MQRNQRPRRGTDGRLPAAAPLANPYVPFQMENPPKYEPRKALVRGTMFPGLDLPFKAAIQASKYMILKFRYLLKKQKDFAVETTLATRTLLKTVKMAQDAGYTVTLLYFWLNSPELAIERVKARVAAGGHDIPEDTIRRRYSVGIYYFFNTYSPICERWILADNSQIPFRVIAEGSKNDLINIKDETTYDKIRTQAFEHHAEVIREQMEHKARNSHE